MNILCNIFGHKYDQSQKFKQKCLRKNCYAYRVLILDKLKQMFGEDCLSWRVIDLNKKDKELR